MLGILGQAVSAIAEGRVVVVIPHARIQAHPLDDGTRIQAVGQGIAVQFVEISHAHRQEGVCEQLDRLGLGRVGEQQRHVPVQRALRQKRRKPPPCLALVAHDDPAGMKVVVQRQPFAQELGREDDALEPGFRPHPVGEADRNRGLDDDRGGGGVLAGQGNHRLDR